MYTCSLYKYLHTYLYIHEYIATDHARSSGVGGGDQRMSLLILY
jgi:hypothetical protein